MWSEIQGHSSIINTSSYRTCAISGHDIYCGKKVLQNMSGYSLRAAIIGVLTVYILLMSDKILYLQNFSANIILIAMHLEENASLKLEPVNVMMMWKIGLTAHPIVSFNFQVQARYVIFKI